MYLSGVFLLGSILLYKPFWGMKPPKGLDGAYPVFLRECFDIMYLILYFGIVSIKCNQYQKWESDEEEE